MAGKFKVGDRVYIKDDPKGWWVEEHGVVTEDLGDGLYSVDADYDPNVHGTYREWDEDQMLKED